MPAIRKTLLDIVQDILSDMDSEPVNSLSDTLEAGQIAAIVENVFYDTVALRSVPEHEELIKLTPLSDSTKPTHFQIPENVTDITKVWYDQSDDDTLEYGRVDWCSPEEFLHRTDSRQNDWVAVTDIESGTQLRIGTDRHPSFYTSFDDFYIIMDSYKSTVDDTLRRSKIRAMGRTIPVFDRFDDGYVPDLDAEYFPHLISESRARAMDFFKGGVTQKAEQAARRAKTYVRNDLYRITRGNRRVNYGRRSRKGH